MTEKIQQPEELCSLSPEYNMRLLRGCSVSDSLVTVIGDQMALRRPDFAPPVLTLHAVAVVLLEVITI